MIDSRMNINSLLTASIDKFIPGMKGATLANYVEFKDFIKNEEGKITGAKLHDQVSGKEFNVDCTTIINCTGIYAD